MLMAKVLFDRQNSKDKNRWRCFQGYQGDIGCPTGESSRTIVFYLVSEQNFNDFRLLPYAVLRR
jgi:heterodisulfide reductase subunit C